MSVRRATVSPEIGFKPGRAYVTTYRGVLSSIMIVLSARPSTEGRSFVCALVDRDMRWKLDSWQAHFDNWIEVGP